MGFRDFLKNAGENIGKNVGVDAFSGENNVSSTPATPTDTPAAPTQPASQNNDVVQSMISPYTTTFDSYTISDEGLKVTVAQFKEKVASFAAGISDPAAFYEKFAQSGLQEEYMDLITKVATAGAGTANTDGSMKVDYSDTKTVLPTVSQFTEQYRAAYDEVKKSGYRTRGEAAYERIFDVANRTDDLLEAQIIFERERLLWEIVPQDALDIFETIREAADPLYRFVHEPLALQVEAYKSAKGDEHLLYLVEKTEYGRKKIANIASMEITVVALFGSLLLSYCNAQIKVWQWINDSDAQNFLGAMVSIRRSLRRLVEFTEMHYSMTFDDILADDRLKLWLLSPGAKDNIGRIKTAMHPQNYDVFREIMKNEILVDKPISEILQSKPAKIVWHDLEYEVKDSYDQKASVKAGELNSHLTYFKYLDALSGTEASKNIEDQLKKRDE